MQGKLAKQGQSFERSTDKLREIKTSLRIIERDILSLIQLKTAIMSSKPQSVNGSESDFEFIETPKAPTPTFEKFEECGVKTTSVSSTASIASATLSKLQ
jgi:hypothetical protein